MLLCFKCDIFIITTISLVGHGWNHGDGCFQPSTDSYQAISTDSNQAVFATNVMNIVNFKGLRQNEIFWAVPYNELKYRVKSQVGPQK